MKYNLDEKFVNECIESVAMTRIINSGKHLRQNDETEEECKKRIEIEHDYNVLKVKEKFYCSIINE